jgi:serine/threonine-protein kinase
VLGDIREFPPQRPEIAAVHGQLMAHALQLGMKRAASVVSSATTQLQIRRIAAESGLPEMAFHKDPASALAWLLS